MMETEVLTIDPQVVTDTFGECLFTDEEMEGLSPGEKPKNTIVVESVLHMFGMHSERVEKTREQVKQWLELLPDEFREGWSFLNLCNDRNGNQWTGLHTVMNELCSLAIALGLGEWTAPKEMWAVMPGGMPYFIVKLETKMEPPTVKGTMTVNSSGTRIVVIECPFCGKKHKHGGGDIKDEPAFGHRIEHCTGDRPKNCPGYNITWDEPERA